MTKTEARLLEALRRSQDKLNFAIGALEGVLKDHKRLIDELSAKKGRK